MKTIIAIIRMAKMNATKDALAQAGLPSFFAPGEVQGRGRGRGMGPTYAQMKDDPAFAQHFAEMGEMPRLKTKRMLTLTVKDELCDTAIQTIMGINQTGNSGDGKIFVLPASEAIQIRTGSSGDAILD